ncbi:MAG: hypothetical protein HOP15_14475 [Planctomycetes bacterium]|nr:hypothetical protein [Planctomycetota bacterium]
MNRVRSTGSLASSACGLSSIFLLFSLPLSAAAQSARVVVSTTDDVAASAGIPFQVTDGDLVVVEPGSPVTPYMADGHFHASCGFVPSDIDAFAYLPNSTPGRAESRAFSLLSNEGGFLDGDILVLARGGGAAVLFTELSIATALGSSAANIDVDALAYDDQGRILFSLADTLGTVLDGDILRLEPGLSGVTLILSEADVQARFTQATGLTDAILDVQALEWGGGKLWIAVQAPSRHDGSVVSMEGTPRVVYDENDLGLGGAEIDALGEMRPGDEVPALHLSKQLALAGDLVHVEARGQPGALAFVFMAGRSGFIDLRRFAGFGGLYVDRQDPWLMALRASHALPIVRFDGAGRYAADFNLPTGAEFGIGPAGEFGWSFQMLQFGPARLAAPFRVEKL